MSSKSPRPAFPLGLFFACTCVVAVVICAGACIAIGRGAALSYGAYAAFLLTASPAGGGLVALFSLRSQTRAARDAAKVCWGAMPSTPNMYAAFSAMSMDSTVSVNSSGALY